MLEAEVSPLMTLCTALDNVLVTAIPPTATPLMFEEEKVVTGRVLKYVIEISETSAAVMSSLK